MTDGAGSRSWWQTLPGVLTALAGVITAVAGLLAALYQAGLFKAEKARDATVIASSPAAESKPRPAAAASSAESTQAAPAKPDAKPAAARINLLAAANGGQVVVASGDSWLHTIDGKEEFNQIDYGLKPENHAVYAFRDEKTAVLDMFTILISGTGDANVKEFELFAGNASPTGPFESLGTFKTQNAKLFKTPYQEFKLPNVRAKYLKIKLLSTFGGSSPNQAHPVVEEVQAFGHFVE